MSVDADRVAAALPAYDIGRELGRGGFGVVLEGRHRQLKRHVAIKQLPRAFGSDPEVRARFLAEARVLATLDHPHVVPVYDYVEADGLCLVVMEKLSGGTLWDRFSDDGLTPQAACAAVLAACAGLQCAHAAGILHRDMKPENLIFSDKGALKVTDFGIAKVLSGQTTKATRAGEVLGTPAYMAPEQAEAKDLSPATDVYAVGVMLYELLSGQLPFSEEGGAMSLLFRHVHDEPTPLDELAPATPDPLVDVTMGALAKDPEERYETAEEFGIAVAQAATSSWGTGWLSSADVPVMAAPRIVAVTERGVSRARRAAPTAPPRQASARADAAAARTGAAGAGRRRSTAAPAPARPSTSVRPQVSTHLSGAQADEVADVSELVSAAEVISPPGPPIAQLLTGAGLFLLALILAMVGLGSPGVSGDPSFNVALNGVAAGTATPSLDLSKPVAVSGSIPPAAAGANSVELAFSAAGIPLGTAREPLASSGQFSVSVDATSSRYLVPKKAMVEARLLRGDAVVDHRTLPVRTSQNPFLTAPAGVTLALLLLAIAYGESLSRSLRRGRKRVAATVGLAITGALLGVAFVPLAWVLAGRLPVVASLVACGLVGAAGGVALALGAGRLGRRRAMKAPARVFVSRG